MSTATFHPAYEAAIALHETGAAVMPLPLGQKVPGGKWAQHVAQPQTYAAALKLFKPWCLDGCNVAVICGQRAAHCKAYLAVLDIDNPDALDDLTRAANKACGTSCAMTQTGRGFQVLFRTQEPIATVTHAAGELRGFGAYAVMPPSLHPNGRYYEWLKHPERLPILKRPDALRDAGVLVRAATEQGSAAVNIGTPAQQVGDFHGLPRRAQAILAGSVEALQHYSSRSEADAALFVTLANAGMDADSIAAWALRSKHSAHWRAQQNPLAALYRDIARCMEISKRCTPQYAKAQEDARELRMQAWAVAWRNAEGVRGETLRAAYLAHIEAAKQAAAAGKGSHHLSVRDGATQARIHRNTFMKATRALQSIGAITQTQQGSKRDALAARYRVVAAPNGAAPQMWGSVTNTSITPGSAPAGVPDSDAFEARALGKAGRAVHAALSAGASTQAEIVARTGRAQQTVARALAALEAHRLAERAGVQRIEGVCRPVTLWRGITQSAAHLEGVAALMQTKGRGARRAAEHRREQAAHKAALAQAKIKAKP